MSAAEVPPPGLSVRAPRPPVIRLRRGVALALVASASALIAGALCWSFIVAPQVRAAARSSPDEAAKEAPPSRGRPAEFVASQPSSYDRLPMAELPEPRILAGGPPVKDGAIARRAPSAATPARAAAVEASQSGLFFATAKPGAPSSTPPAEPPRTPAEAQTPPLRLASGSVIPATLLTAIDTIRPGPVVAVVSSGVYDSLGGDHLLIPQGARLLGRHEGASRHGEARAFIVWAQLTLPNGATHQLQDEPGVDAQGAIGVEGEVERRLGQLSIATLFAGAITTLGQLARDKDDAGLLGDVGDAAAIEAARVGGRLIDRELQVSSSVRLEPGAPVRVLLTRDLVLPAYRP